MSFAVGIGLSLCANVASASELKTFSIAVAACQPLALLLPVELLDQALKRRRAEAVRENVHESGEAEPEHPPSTDRNEDSAPRETPEKAEQVPAVRTATKSALRQ